MDNKLVKQFDETQNEISKIESQIVEQTANLQKKLSTLREQDSKLRAAIKESMERNEIKKFENDVFSVTYVAGTTRTSFDSKKFKADHPKTYEKYTKESNVSSSVRIKLK